MLLKTGHFGEIEIGDESVITFEGGIPGFEDMHRFVILEDDEQSLLKWLQSIDNAELAFIIVNPFAIKKDYDIEIKDEVVKQLRINEPSDAVIYSIVVVPEDTSKISMNLKAPIVINSKTKVGAQVVLEDDKYTVRHYILEEMNRQEG